MTEEKKTNTYKKPEVEVIKLDKAASFMTGSSDGPIGTTPGAFIVEEDEGE